MIVVVLDLSKGETHAFKTRKRAGEFLGISEITLRKYLKRAFFLKDFLVIIPVGKKDFERSEEAIF